MGNNIRNTNQKKRVGVFEDINRPISFTTPAKLIRRIPHRSKSPSPSNPDDNDRSIDVKTKHNPPDELVQFKYKAEPFGKKTHGFFGNKAPPPSSSVSRAGTSKTRFGKLESNDDRFTDYINKAKLKIRAMTNLGDFMNTDAPETETKSTATASVSKESDQDEHLFSDYIKRAKMKIRATSSLGGGNLTYDSFSYTKD